MFIGRLISLLNTVLAVSFTRFSNDMKFPLGTIAKVHLVAESYSMSVFRFWISS